MQDPTPSTGQRVQHITVTDPDAGQRLDNWLLRLAKGVPKSHIYKVVRSGQVRINGGRVKVSVRLKVGDVVRVPPMDIKSSAPVRVPDRLLGVLERSVLLKTEDYLVINKPAGIAVHGGSGLSFGAIDGLRQLFNAPRMELVHRLDRATSGALLIAPDRNRCRVLQEQFRQRTVAKHYLALVSGDWPESVLTVNAPLTANSEHAGERRVMVDHENGKSAVTHMVVQERFQNVSLLAITLDTGRTHQIRVHTASRGCPVVGDERYGNNQDNQRYRRLGLNRLYLHAAQLTFDWDGQSVTCDAPVDNEWEQSIKRLRGKGIA